MKSKITLLLVSLFLTVFISCQEEIAEVIQPSESEAIQADSVVAVLVQKTATKDGSKDNIIDNASCLSVQLPVTVQVNGLEINIDSEEDFEVIEAIFDEFDDDIDNLDIVFPIVIILSDFTEITITSFNELENFISECEGENELDDDIECIDFVYPITISVFDSESQLAETITISNDEEFYKFIDEIEDNHVAQINFPITVELYDGTQQTINNMDELETAIDAADGMCDEDDDNDYDDDDCLDCTDEQITNLLTTCSWTVDKIIIDDIENTEQYTDFTFTFLENGTVFALASGNEIVGTWVIDTTDNGTILVKLNFENLPDFSFDWVLYEIEDDNEIDLRTDENRLEFEKTCNEGTNELVDILKEGLWIVANYNNEGEDFTSNYNEFLLDFKTEFILTATKGGDIVNGTWSVVNDSGTLKLELDFGEVIPFDEFNEDWLVVDITTIRVEVNNLDNSGVEESNLVFERM